MKYRVRRASKNEDGAPLDICMTLAVRRPLTVSKLFTMVANGTPAWYFVVISFTNSRRQSPRYRPESNRLLLSGEQMMITPHSNIRSTSRHGICVEGL